MKQLCVSVFNTHTHTGGRLTQPDLSQRLSFEMYLADTFVASRVVCVG